MKRIIICLALIACSFATAKAAYTIYPTPHSQTAGTAAVSITKAVNVVCESGIDRYTRARLEEILDEKGYTWTYGQTASATATNIYLGINASGQAADLMATAAGIDRSMLLKAGKFDRHFISVTAKGIVILGEHTNATFFGLASLEQMLEQPNADGTFAATTIYDYADLQYRGVVEGYYGYPWTCGAKLDLMDFFKRYKMNTYIYGAKSDPYHSGYWDQAYPTSITEDQTQRGWLTQDMMKELAAKALATKVDFIWAVHPGMASAVNFTSTGNVDAGVTRVMKKFDLMHELGIRQFGVFLDDCAWDVKYSDNYAYFLTQIQNKLDATYNKNYSDASDTVKPLHFVPSPYYIGSFNATTLSTYFGAIGKTDPKITVYITGSGVWSRPNNSTFQTMQSYLGRKAALWWNYPCNDNADSRLYLTDMYTTMSRMAAGNLGKPDADFSASLGIASNPMQEGEAAKICLFGVADYCWNNAGFNSTKNWEASFPAIVGKDKAKALRYFADYGINEDPASVNTLISAYKTALTNGTTADATKLSEKMDSVEWCCTELRKLESSESKSDVLLYSDLKPWINKLYDMADIVKGFVALKMSTAAEEEEWAKYATLNKKVDALDTSYDYVVQTLEGSGTSAPKADHWVTPSNNYIAPFAKYMNENGFNSLFPKRNSSGVTTAYSNITLSTNKIFVDANTGVCFLRTTSMTYKPGEFVGVNFNQLQKLTDIFVADTMFVNFRVQYSSDGKKWTDYNKGDAVPGEHVAYIRFVNKTDKDQTLMMKNTMFTYTIPVAAAIKSLTVPTVSSTEGTTANMFDGDYSTFYWSKVNQVTGDAYTATLASEVPVYDVRICFGGGDSDAPGALDKPTAGKVQISADGSKWTDLKVTGTGSTSFGPSSIKKYNGTVDYIDFDGTGATAKYVRLYVATANTGRWMKINEVEVNSRYQSAAVEPIAVDASGSAVTNVVDTKASTKYAPTSAGSLLYRFIQSKKLDTVRIYTGNDVYNGEDPKILLTNDGQTWYEAGTLRIGLNVVDMTSNPEALAMKITWTAKSCPTIYEITESGTELTGPIDGITSAADGSETLQYKMENGTAVFSSQAGIRNISVYDVDGSKLLTKRFHNEKHACIPDLGRRQGMKILKVEFENGKVTAVKIK